MTVKSYSSTYDYPITTPSGRVVRPAAGRCWNTSKENFEKQQFRDRVKDKYCFDRNIPIIRIPYVMLNFMTIDDLRLETSNFILTRENEEEYYKKYAEIAEKELG